MNDIEKIVERVIDNIDLDSEYLSDKLSEAGFKNIVDLEYGNEDRECDNVTWDDTYSLEYNDEKYRLYVSGTAIAEISYERWVDTFGYNIDDWNLEKYNED